MPMLIKIRHFVIILVATLLRHQKIVSDIDLFQLKDPVRKFNFPWVLE